jgi:hypothetical protein
MNILLGILIVVIGFIVSFFVFGTFFCSEFLKITTTDLCYTTEYILGDGHLIKRVTNTGLPIIEPIADWEVELFEKGEYVKRIF